MSTTTGVRPPELTWSPEADWRKRGRRRLVAALVVVAVAVAASAIPFRAEEHRYTGQPLVLVASAPSAEGWRTELRRGGLLAEVGPIDLTRRDIVVIPADAALDAAAIDRITAWVRDGGILVSAHAGLLSATGLILGSPQMVTAVRDRHFEAERLWPGDVEARPLRVADGARPLHSLAATSDFAIAAGHDLGAGRVLALGWDPLTTGQPPDATAPHLLGWILEAAPRPPLIERDGVNLYFVPSFARQRYGSALSVEDLADRLAVARLVYLDGSDLAAFESADIDLAALVDALHDRGVLAYLWLAPHRVVGDWRGGLSIAQWDGIHVTGADGAERQPAVRSVIDAVEGPAQVNGWPVTVAGTADDLGTPLDVAAPNRSGPRIRSQENGFAGQNDHRRPVGDADGAVDVFALGLIRPADLLSLPRMLSSTATVDGSTFDSPHPLVVRAPADHWHELYVDGKPYPNAGGAAVLPVGRHTVEWREGYSDRPGIVRTSVALRAASAKRGQLSLTYDSTGVGLLVLDDRPTDLVVDGEAADLAVREHDGTYVVRLPRGESIEATLQFE